MSDGGIGHNFGESNGFGEGGGGAFFFFFKVAVGRELSITNMHKVL